MVCTHKNNGEKTLWSSGTHAKYGPLTKIRGIKKISKGVPSFQFSNTKMTTKPRAKRNFEEQKYSNDCRPTILGVYNHFAPFCSSKFLLALGFVVIFV